MPRVEKHHRHDRSFEDKILVNRFLIRTRPINKERGMKPQLIAFFKHQYGETLVGEIIETRSDTHYVIRKIIKEGLEASPLGEYRNDRPHVVTLPNDASGIVADKKRIASRHRESYKKILFEIKEEGGNVEMPLENNGLFNLS